VYNVVDDESNPRTTPVIGLIGLGNMGAAIAGRLALHTRPIVLDLDADKVAEVASRDRVEVAGTIADFSPADIVVLSLPHPAASRAVVAELVGHLRPGGVIVETSTVGPDLVAELAGVASARGIGFIDAALAAGVGQMRDGVAAALVGGDPEVIERARPALDAFTGSVYVIGELGRGAALKVINNAVAHAVMVVLVEAAALAAANGIDRAHLIRLMTGSDAGLTRPLEHRLMERIAVGDFDGGMPTAAALKDSTLALALAQELHVPLFAIGGSHAVYEIANAAGLGRLDYAAIAKLWEDWLGLPLSVAGAS
jgi:3-hydroxyisobutyrate dehydrogenase